MSRDWTLLREVDSRATLDQMEDGEVGLVRTRDGIEVYVKCSHREDGVCSACLLPALDGIIGLRATEARLRRRVSTLEGRLARVLRWASAADLLTWVNDDIVRVSRGRVWSSRRTGGKR